MLAPPQRVLSLRLRSSRFRFEDLDRSRRCDRSNPDPQIAISMTGCIAWRVSLTSVWQTRTRIRETTHGIRSANGLLSSCYSFEIERSRWRIYYLSRQVRIWKLRICSSARTSVCTKFSLLFAIQIAALSACFAVREKKKERNVTISRSAIQLLINRLTAPLLDGLCTARERCRGQFKLNLFFKTHFLNNLNEPFNSGEISRYQCIINRRRCSHCIMQESSKAD